jgi:hypothetical protein
MLAVLVTAQGVCVPLTSDFSRKNDAPAPFASFNSAQACPVYCALPGKHTGYFLSLIARGLLTGVEKSRMSDLSQLDRLCPHRHSRCRFPEAENPTLLALNCMLTV